jgi:hypothetical protein
MRQVTGQLPGCLLLNRRHDQDEATLWDPRHCSIPALSSLTVSDNAISDCTAQGEELDLKYSADKH